MRLNRSSAGMPRVIESVRARGLELAVARPVETASGVLRTIPLVLLDINTSDAIVGHAYVRCYTSLELGALVRLFSDVGEVLTGVSAAPAVVASRLRQLFRLTGIQGLVGMVMAGIDMALWDACARESEVPLVVLLGGEPRSIAAYASLRSMNRDRAVAEAQAAVEQGFRAVKVKVGGSSIAADLDMIRALRRALGDQVRLMIDYNQSLAVSEANDRVRVLDGEGLYWIEEPTRADDFDGNARIAAAAQTAIQLGENWWGPEDMAKGLAAHSCDHATFDVMKLGGVSGWLQTLGLTRAAGMLTSSHAFPELSAHLLGVTPTGHYLEYIDHAGPILRQPIQIQDGHAVIAEGPGSGIEWDDAAVERAAAG